MRLVWVWCGCAVARMRCPHAGDSSTGWVFGSIIRPRGVGQVQACAAGVAAQRQAMYMLGDWHAATPKPHRVASCSGCAEGLGVQGLPAGAVGGWGGGLQATRLSAAVCSALHGGECGAPGLLPGRYLAAVLCTPGSCGRGDRSCSSRLTPCLLASACGA
jgi:hypothetical protein